MNGVISSNSCYRYRLYMTSTDRTGGQMRTGGYLITGLKQYQHAVYLLSYEMEH